MIKIINIHHNKKEKGEFVERVHFITIHEIIERYRHELTTKEIKELLNALVKQNKTK